MSLKQNIQRDLDSALKQGQAVALSTLRILLSSVLNKEKEKRFKISKIENNLSEKDLEEKSLLKDEEIIDVIVSEAKKRRESIIAFEQGKREDLAKKEKEELQVLQKYLPEQLPEEELRKIIQETINKVKDPSARASTELSRMSSGQVMGKIMAEIMPKIKGRADGNMVSKIVKELLAK